MSNRSLGVICLALFLIGYGISTVTNIEFAPIVVAILALAAGILLLIGR